MSDGLNDKKGEAMTAGQFFKRISTPSPDFETVSKALSEEETKELVEEIMDSRPNVKDTNPKDAVGVRKSPISTVSAAVIAELGLAMLEGARKYGRHNYRVSGVRASVYWDALFRHLMAWWDFSQDDDPDSGLPHIVKAMACLCVLRDAQHLDNWVDDRPPPLPIELLEKFNQLASDIIDRHPNAKDPFTNKDSDKAPNEF